MSLAEVATLPALERATQMVTRTVPRRPTRAARVRGNSLVRMIATVGGTFGAGLAVAVVAIAMNGQPRGEAASDPVVETPELGAPLGELALAPALSYHLPRSDLAIDDGHDLYAELINFREQAASGEWPATESPDGLYAPDVPVMLEAVPGVAADTRPPPPPEPTIDPRSLVAAVTDLLASPEVRALSAALALEGPPPLLDAPVVELRIAAAAPLHEAALLMATADDAALAARLYLLRGDSAGALRVAPPGALRARALFDQGLGAEALVEVEGLADALQWRTRIRLIEAFRELDTAPARRQFEVWAEISSMLEIDGQAPMRAALSLRILRNGPLKWRIAARLRELTGADCGIDADAWQAALRGDAN